jgi:hypothetical protein
LIWLFSLASGRIPPVDWLLNASRQSCRKARIFALVWESSGESRLERNDDLKKVIALEPGDRDGVRLAPEKIRTFRARV